MPAGRADRSVAVLVLLLAPVGGLFLLFVGLRDGRSGLALAAALITAVNAALFPYFWRRDFKSDDAD